MADPNQEPIEDDENNPEEVFIDESEVLQEIPTNKNEPIEDLGDDADYEDIENEDIANEDNENQLLDDSIQGFFEHKEPVYSITINPVQPNIAVSGGGDDLAYLFDHVQGVALFKLSGHTDSVISTDFSADGKYVATGSMDGVVKIWTTHDGQLVQSLEGPLGLEWIKFHPRGAVILVGGSDGTAWMWNAVTGECMKVFAGHSGAIAAGKWFHSGKKLVTGSEDGSMRIWDPKNGNTITNINGPLFHESGVVSLAINADDTLILSGSSDSKACLTRVDSGKIVNKFTGHTESVETVAFAPTLPLVVTGSLDNKVIIWDANTTQQRQICQHDDGIVKVKFHTQHSELLYTASLDSAIRLWDIRSGTRIRKWTGHLDNILDFDLHPSGDIILSASEDKTVLVFANTI